MSKEIEKKIGQLQYEISLLGLDQEELTGVTIRTDELKDLVKNLSIHGVSKSFAVKDSKDFKIWLKDKNINRDSNDCYDWNGMKYVRQFFFEKYIEDKNEANVY